MTGYGDDYDIDGDDRNGSNATNTKGKHIF